MEIGAYFQVYKQPTSTRRSLDYFRSIYPTGTVVLVSDNGLNYSKMAKEFDCIYFHEPENTNLVFSPTNRQRILAFFERLRRCVQPIKEDYFLLLEDDVLVIQRVIEPLVGTVNGNFLNTLPKEKVRFFKNLTHIPCDFQYTGHGGSIVHTKKFLEMVNDHELIQYVLDTWDASGLGETMGFDSLLSVLTVVAGGTLAPLACKKDYYTDGLFARNVDNVCILHQCKDLYSSEKFDESVIY